MRDELVELEAELSHLRCRQHVLVNALDRVNAAARDGYRSSVGWLSAQLDVDRSTAADLVYADQLRVLPGGETRTRAQRQADGLVAMAQDSHDRRADTGEATDGSSVSIFVDLGEADGTGGESGAAIEYGPRIGPAALEELLRTGRVQIIGLSHGRPVVTSTASRAIPPAIRRAVAHRNGGCVITGCTSRYRLQPHHVQRRVDGGGHDPDILATLCWFHHHIAIHQDGFRIDPGSPPLRRRLIRSATGTDPPG